MQQLHRRGVKLFISTGRHPRMLQYLRDLFPFDGWVTMSGQFCYCGDQVIHRNPMDRQAVEELVSAASSNAFSCIFLEGHDIYINYANDQTHVFMKDLNLPLPPVQDPRRALDGELYQAITFLTKENEHLLLDRAPHLKTTRWHPTFLDVIPATGGKDKGMDAMLDHFGLTPEEAMAFGDGENDLTMLRHAGIGRGHGVRPATLSSLRPTTPLARWTRTASSPPCGTLNCCNIPFLHILQFPVEFLPARVYNKPKKPRIF